VCAGIKSLLRIAFYNNGNTNSQQKIMKSNQLILAIAAICALGACSKPRKGYETTPVQFNKTKYAFLGTFDSLGKPSNLIVPRDTISEGLLQFFYRQLHVQVDATVTHPELFTSMASANLNITAPSKVYVTFVQESAAYYNSVGFYTYSSNMPPTSPDDLAKITYIFPSAKLTSHSGSLVPGDKVLIGTFPAGVSIGFVLFQNGFSPKKPGTLDYTAPHYCSADNLNPENDPKLKRHVVLLYYAPEHKTLISFEDRNRTAPDCDNSFANATIYTTQVPAQ